MNKIKYMTWLKLNTLYIIFPLQTQIFISLCLFNGYFNNVMLFCKLWLTHVNFSSLVLKNVRTPPPTHLHVALYPRCALFDILVWSIPREKNCWLKKYPHNHCISNNEINELGVPCYYFHYIFTKKSRKRSITINLTRGTSQVKT